MSQNKENLHIIRSSVGWIHRKVANDLNRHYPEHKSNTRSVDTHDMLLMKNKLVTYGSNT